ncbi:MAG TPA: hypothetical protein VLG74_06200 [Blastocatellia bacterium]|nr:hypothetical protein [Blastocatellia bacterium]
MSDISTSCPRCRRSLEIPSEFDSVICPGCATAYRIRRHGDLINLSEIWSDSSDSPGSEDAEAVIESRLAELDELIEEAESELETLRGQEQSVPLQKGCAFFGLFTLVITVIAVFMLVGKDYVGSWIFYVSVAVVVLLGLARIRRKVVNTDQIQDLRRERKKMEDGLTQLQAERQRIERLKSQLHPIEPNN